MTSPLPCPNCKSRYSAHVAPTGRILCINCTREWDSQASYDITAMLLGLPEFTEEPDYIEDGELRDELMGLVRASKIRVLELVRSQLCLLDWNKSGNITVEEMDTYLRRTVEDIREGRL